MPCPFPVSHFLIPLIPRSKTPPRSRPFSDSDLHFSFHVAPVPTCRVNNKLLTLSHYRRAMKTAGKFLLVLVGATTLRLQQPDYAALPQPQQRSNRGAINHFGRENLQELHPGIKKTLLVLSLMTALALPLFLKSLPFFSPSLSFYLSF
jgi:hypothetical protein